MTAGSKLAAAVPDVVKTTLGLSEDLEIPNVKNPAALSSIKLVQLNSLFFLRILFHQALWL